MKNASMRRLLLTFFAQCLLPISAFAHTGAGHVTGFATGLDHPMGGADHMLAMIAVGLWAAQMGGRAVWFVPTAFVSMMVAGGAMGMSGIHLPFVEEGILVSVMVLGVLIAGALKFPLTISGALVGLFAIFHGHAHGAEMPSQLGAVSYAVGFVLATSLLHATGILGGIALQRLNIERLTRIAGCAIVLSGVYLAVS